jgi:hypothetical protein
MRDGKVVFVVIVALVLAAVAGRIVAVRHHRRVLALMSGALRARPPIACSGSCWRASEGCLA